MSSQEISLKPPQDKVRHGDPIPKTPIYLAMGIVVCTLVFVIGSKFVGVGSWELDNGTAVESRSVIWLLNEDQSITVKDAASGGVLETVTLADGGFIHSAYRGLAHERKVKRVPMETPLTISLMQNGRYQLEDKATDERIHLRAFGKDNEAALGRYVTMEVQ